MENKEVIKTLADTYPKHQLLGMQIAYKVASNIAQAQLTELARPDVLTQLAVASLQDEAITMYIKDFNYEKYISNSMFMDGLGIGMGLMTGVLKTNYLQNSQICKQAFQEVISRG